VTTSGTAANSAADRRSFNRYADGYSAYTPGDLQLILGDLLAAARERPLARVCAVGCRAFRTGFPRCRGRRGRNPASRHGSS
jgi:hypothetical protein